MTKPDDIAAARVMPEDGVSAEHPCGWYPKRDQRALLRAARRCQAMGAVVEVGSWDGQSAQLLAGHFGRLICVDPWGVGPDYDVVVDQGAAAAYERFLSNTWGLPITRFRCEWQRFCAVFDGPLAFAHIDAVHEYPDVKDNIAAFLPMLEAGGVLAGHDAQNPFYPGVLEAVYELLPADQVVVEGWVWSWKKPR